MLEWVKRRNSRSQQHRNSETQQRTKISRIPDLLRPCSVLEPGLSRTGFSQKHELATDIFTFVLVKLRACYQPAVLAPDCLPPQFQPLCDMNTAFKAYEPHYHN
jgi:hypothetical protein